MNENRNWMYQRLIDGFLNPEFVFGVEKFLEFACAHTEWMDGEKIKCPCRRSKCQNRQFLDRETVKYHLLRHAFKAEYIVWNRHGETNNVIYEHHSMDSAGPSNPMNDYHTMVIDAAGHSFDQNYEYEENPNPTARQFYDMLDSANNPLWQGCENHSQLSVVARMLNIKADHHLSERAFDAIAKLMKEIVPKENLIAESFYETKRMVRGLGLPVEKIHCCPNGCMIYWGEDLNKTLCRFYDHPRFKKNNDTNGKGRKKTDIPFKKMYYFPLKDRLLRLYSSKATANEMRWHAEHVVEDNVMQHSSDSIAWKHFNDVHPDFAIEIRNVRLGLCTDGFQPFGQSGQQYSCWPVIVTVYNLPPWLCMKDASMFLTVLIPAPRNPKDKLDVYLQPLIHELNLLWDYGVEAFDISRNQNFQLRAALMWTISDFPAYSMLSGWSTAGRLACPYCMEDSKSFRLNRSGKQSWFDNHRKFLELDHPFRRNKSAFLKNKIVTIGAPPVRSGSEILSIIDHLDLKKVTEVNAYDINRGISQSCGWRKRSIFWDLPYWSSNLIRHNLDVMHIEKNVFDNLFNTVLNIHGKTKDTLKSRQELNTYCRKPELDQLASTSKYPKACYTLDNRAEKELFDWLTKLKFPDGYVSNMGRCVD